MRVLWVVVHESVEQNMCHRRHPHRSSGVTGVRLEGRIDLELREISIKFPICSTIQKLSGGLRGKLTARGRELTHR